MNDDDDEMRNEAIVTSASLDPSSFVILHPCLLMLFLFTLFLVCRFVEQLGQPGFVGDLDLDEPAGPVGIVGQVFEVVGQRRVDGRRLRRRRGCRGR